MLDYAEFNVRFLIDNYRSLAIKLTTAYSWSHHLHFLLSSRGGLKRKLLDSIFKFDFGAINSS